MSAPGPLVEGNLALDLINTEEDLWGTHHDYIDSSEDFSLWLTDEELAAALSKYQLPLKAGVWSDQLEKVHQLRDEVRTDFEQVLQNGRASETTVERLEGYIEQAPFTLKLREGQAVYVPVGDPVAKLCSLVAANILKLIGDGRMAHVRRCANPKCLFMFEDATGRRKWCSMKRCGNRAKVTRHLKGKAGHNN
jgi:predicted RNA-binding Zn ribbon-like protein